jgi:hypothetical protein
MAVNRKPARLLIEQGFSNIWFHLNSVRIPAGQIVHQSVQRFPKQSLGLWVASFRRFFVPEV